MLKLDHITVIAPTLVEGVSHVRDCLDIDVPFGARHDYMGTYNHRLRLGGDVYLEIVALDPGGVRPERPRWFGLDDPDRVREDWSEGRRLRGWVAGTEDMRAVVAGRRTIFGDAVPLPPEDPSFAFAIPEDGSLPLDGAAPSIIDRRGIPERKRAIPDLGARLLSFTLEHPDTDIIEALYRELAVDRPPTVVRGPKIRYRAEIETPDGVKVLT